MTALEYPALVSVADYLAGEKSSDVKHEYLGGTVHAMAGATNQHNVIALNSLLSIGGQLRGKTCQPCNSDVKVRIEFPDHTRFYYPDAMVVCHSNPLSNHFQDQPVVIVEVLSDSCHGKPTIRGLRYPVEAMLEYLAGGDTFEDILAEFPDLEREDLQACLQFAAESLKLNSAHFVAA